MGVCHLLFLQVTTLTFVNKKKNKKNIAVIVLYIEYESDLDIKMSIGNVVAGEVYPQPC